MNTHTTHLVCDFITSSSVAVYLHLMWSQILYTGYVTS